MKNKISISLLSRWVFAPLLVASLIAWGVSPAYPGNTSTMPASRVASTQTPGTVPEKADNNTLADVQEIKDRIKELEAKERQNSALALEGQRKTMDWWFSFLAVLTAVMAIFGGLIPFLMARKDKELIEQDKAQIKQRLAEIEGMGFDAASHVEKIHKHEAEAAKAKEELQSYQSGAQVTANKDKIQQAITSVQKDKVEDTELGLRAAAVAASEAEEAEKAYALWNALTQLNKVDATAQFNAGYWAGQLSLNSQGAEKLPWIKLVIHHNEQALRIKPDMHEAAYNWGNALDDAAQAMAATDPAAARTLWQQAGEKYQLALSIKPDMHDAADNWGGALLHEANAIADSDAGRSRALLIQAEQLLLAHADVAPGKVSYNLACVYGQRGDVAQCLQWLKVCQTHENLLDCEHVRKDKDLDAVRGAPEFIAWLESVCNDTVKQS